MGPLRSPGTLLVATLAACGPIAYAATYTVTDLGTLGGNRSSAAAINARGDVVGWSTLAGDSAIHAFLYQSRHPRMIDVDPRGATVSSEALAINDRGCIAGDIAARVDGRGDRGLGGQPLRRIGHGIPIDLDGPLQDRRTPNQPPVAGR